MYSLEKGTITQTKRNEKWKNTRLLTMTVLIAVQILQLVPKRDVIIIDDCSNNY
jgi:hypothetical protein